MEDDYYELMPSSPIKKLKKELEELKKSLINTSQQNTYNEIMKEVMETIKINQRIIEDMVKSNAALQTKISEMIIVMNRLIEEIGIMGDSFKKAAEAMVMESKTEKTEELLTKLLSEMTKLITQNQNILDSLSKMEKQMIQRQLGPSLNASPSPIPRPLSPQGPPQNISLNQPLPSPNQSKGQIKLPKL